MASSRAMADMGFSTATFNINLGTLIHFLLLTFTSVSCINSDRYGLLAFKEAISADPTGALRNWNPSDVSPCSWNGILCISIGHEHRVVGINLPDKSLVGLLPKGLRALSELQRINLRNNSFSGTIPPEITQISTLHKIILGSNRLSGNLPQSLGNITNLEYLDVSGNLLEGSIPTGLKNLEHLNLSRNMLSGNIPQDLSVQRGALLDLSDNNLTGVVPPALQSVPPAAFFGNVGLCGVPLVKPCGKVPVAGRPPSPPTVAGVHHKDEKMERPKEKDGGLSIKEILAIVVGDAVGIVLLGLVFVYCFRRNKVCEYFKRRRGKDAGLHSDRSSSICTRLSKSLYCLCYCCCCCSGDPSEWLGEDQSGNEGELILLETDRNDRLNFDLEDLLRASAYVLSKGGSGGIVYKAVLESGVTLAVRRLAGDAGNAAGHKKQKAFDAEVQVVGRIRHPCIVKLRAYYSGPDEKLLVYDYIPNGSLFTALHGQPAPYSSLTSLTWAERVKIARRVAEGLAYIHDCGPKKYIHGDVRPKNVLLGSNMDAYVSDFGLNRLITISGSANNSRSGSRNANTSASLASQVVVQGSSTTGSSFGLSSSVPVEDEFDEFLEQQMENEAYRPPESRLGSSKPSQKWDVYAFGVVMLELISGRSATQSLKVKKKQQRKKQESSEGSNKEEEMTSMPVVEWARKMWEGKRPVYELLDPTLMHGIAPQQRDVAEFLRIALSCVVVASEQRPKMKQVSEWLKKLGSS